MPRLRGKVWQGSGYATIDGQRQRKQVNFKSETEAIAYEANPQAYWDAKLAPKVTVRELFREGKVKLWSGTKDENDCFRIAEEMIGLIGPETDPNDIDEQTISDIIEALKAKGNATLTIEKKLVRLNRLLKYGKTVKRCITVVPDQKEIKSLTLTKVYKGQHEFFTEIEATKVRNGLKGALDNSGNVAIPAERHQAFFDFLLWTGCRYSEAAPNSNRLRRDSPGLQWRHIDKGSTHRKPSVTFDHTKGGGKRQVRKIPLIPQAMATLDFNRPSPWHDIDYKRFLKDMKQAAQAVGINPHRVGAHILRHTCASWMVQDGVSIMFVQKWLGHTNIQTTMVYAHLAPDTLELAAKSLMTRQLGITQEPIRVPEPAFSGGHSICHTSHSDDMHGSYVD